MVVINDWALTLAKTIEGSGNSTNDETGNATAKGYGASPGEETKNTFSPGSFSSLTKQGCKRPPERLEVELDSSLRVSNEWQSKKNRLN